MYFSLMVGYIWQQPTDLLIVLSASILTSLSFCLEPGWLIHFQCGSNSVPLLLKTHQDLFTTEAACGLSCTVWVPLCSGTQTSLWPRLLPLCSLSFSYAVLLVDLQVKFAPSLQTMLRLTLSGMFFSQIFPHFTQITFQSLCSIPCFVHIST